MMSIQGQEEDREGKDARAAPYDSTFRGDGEALYLGGVHQPQVAIKQWKCNATKELNFLFGLIVIPLNSKSYRLGQCSSSGWAGGEGWARRGVPSYWLSMLSVSKTLWERGIHEVKGDQAEPQGS